MFSLALFAIVFAQVIALYALIADASTFSPCSAHTDCRIGEYCTNKLYDVTHPFPVCQSCVVLTTDRNGTIYQNEVDECKENDAEVWEDDFIAYVSNDVIRDVID